MQQWCDRGIGPTKRFYTKRWCVAESLGEPILKHRGLPCPAALPVEIIENPTSSFVRDFVGGRPSDMRILMVRRVSDNMREGRADGVPMIAADATLRDALALMLARHVENLNVEDGKSHITVRDILR